jgi:hypothetical protein
MGTTLNLRPTRYDARQALASFAADSALIEDGVALLELTLSTDHEIDIELPAPNGPPSAEVIELARLALRNLAALDLIVQIGCAQECERTKLDSDNFESWLAGISITLDTITLHYWGDVVNTEWDEVFSLLDGKWIHTASGTGAGTGAVVSLNRLESPHDA